MGLGLACLLMLVAVVLGPVGVLTAPLDVEVAVVVVTLVVVVVVVVGVVSAAAVAGSQGVVSW